MSKIDKYIDELFHKKLSGAGSTVPAVDSEWLQMRKIIRQKNFMRFSLNSFNVYYFSSAVAIISTATVLTIKDKNPDKEIEVIETPANLATDSIYLIDSLAIDTDSVFQLNSEPEHIRAFEQTNCGQEQEPAVQIAEPDRDVFNEPADTVQIPTNTIELHDKKGSEKQEQEALKKPIVPADTIVKIDTVRVQKKKILFKRKGN